MNLLLLEERDRRALGFAVDGPRARHLLEVMGVGPGDELWAGLADGPRGRLRVSAASSGVVELEGELDVPSERPCLHLVLAVPRPKFLRRLVPQVCAIGLARLDLVRSWRVPRAYLGTPSLAPEGLRTEIDEGRAQGQWTHRVALRFWPRFEAFGSSLAPPSGSRWLAVPGGPPAEPAWGEPTVAIGPERGWTDYEVERFKAAGFTPIGLGPGVLRVDTACIAGLSRAARDLERHR